MTSVRIAPGAGAEVPAGVRPPGFALFAEMLLVGVIVSALALPVVTALPALAAGIGHLDRHAGLRSDRLGQLLTEFRGHLRGVWAYAIGLPLVAVLLVFNVLTASTASVPGLVVRWVSIALGASVAVVIMRAAARKAAAPLSWREAMRLGRGDARRDLAGSVLLVVAAVLCVVVVWMLVPLIVLVPGMVTLAIVGIGYRRGAAVRN